jgi:hypothetical protein
VKKCLGPCVAACTHDDYRARVLLARGFLDGRDTGPLDGLRAQMDAAAGRLEFERAALLRDKVRRLELLQEQFDRLRFAVETLSFAYVVPGEPGRAPGRRKAGDAAPAAEPRVYLVRRGRVRGDYALPNDAPAAAALADAARAVFRPGERGGSAVPTHEVRRAAPAVVVVPAPHGRARPHDRARRGARRGGPGGVVAGAARRGGARRPTLAPCPACRRPRRRRPQRTRSRAPLRTPTTRHNR